MGGQPDRPILRGKMKFTVDLHRMWEGPDWTGGLLTVPGLPYLFTMEPGPDKRILPGEYEVFKRDPVQYKGTKYPDAFEIIVPGRIAVLFHPGNRPNETKGCILPGCGLNFHQKMVEDSGSALKMMTEVVGEKFTLVVRETS